MELSGLELSAGVECGSGVEWSRVESSRVEPQLQLNSTPNSNSHSNPILEQRNYSNLTQNCLTSIQLNSLLNSISTQVSHFSSARLDSAQMYNQIQLVSTEPNSAQFNSTQPTSTQLKTELNSNPTLLNKSLRSSNSTLNSEGV